MIAIFLISAISIAAVMMLFYAYILPIKLPPKTHMELNRIADFARKHDKRALKVKHSRSSTMEEKEGLTLTIGKGEDGKDLTHSMVTYPALGLFGGSGGGKTNTLHKVLLSAAEYPSDVNLYLLSKRKNVVFQEFQKLLGHKVHVGLDEIERDKYLSYIVEEIERREALIAEAAKKSATIEDIITYNRVYKNEKLPYILLAVDEVAALLEGDLKKKNLPRIQKILQEGRSSGVVCVLGTQYFSAENLSGKVLENLSCKVALNVASGEGSKKILGVRGAEKLDRDKGEGLYKNPNGIYKFTNPFLSRTKVAARIKKINKKLGFSI